MDSLKKCQESLQQRFDCYICLSPKFNMISGLCQHRICDECLYLNEERRPCMDSCPMCGLSQSFPIKKPVIPSQVIDLQRCIGIQECPNKCSIQMWYWEVDEHLGCCPNMPPDSKASQPSQSSKRKRSPRKCRRRVSDLGPVTITSRVKRNSRAKQQSLRRSSRTPSSHLRSCLS